MFLKNVATRGVVVINTVVGKIGISAGEVIDLKHKLLPPVNRNIKQVTEEEYKSFRKGTKEVEEPVEEIKSEVIDQNTEMLDTLDKEQDTLIKEVSKDLNEGKVADWIKNLMSKDEPTETKLDIPEETVVEDPLQVVETNSSSKLEELEEQLEILTKTWKEAKTPKRKDKIHKQIKELKKQINKLNKDLEADK